MPIRRPARTCRRRQIPLDVALGQELAFGAVAFSLDVLNVTLSEIGSRLEQPRDAA